ncbi:CvpA family protein [Ectobacillus sp. JY-23]|uniref:CvpA family protein n=1 Tax=Ectobacillus sp. JY-23 TaxID=2933872 RepID=UPI001FF32036|nr:CvpA family protein [Ectobacillus sp. JY-23]UOY94252.1 CvpA family protein [Ectobacillus sp. JY-23]
MIDLLIIALLLLGFIVGLKRGLILQAVRLIGFIAAYFVAYMYCDDVAPILREVIPYPLTTSAPVWLEEGGVEEVFYRGIAFVILFFVTKISLSLIGHLLNMFAQIPVLKQANALGGAVLGVVEIYIVLFVLILIGTLLPIQEVQASIEQSALCQIIADNTPVLSDKVKELWAYGDRV